MAVHQFFMNTYSALDTLSKEDFIEVQWFNINELLDHKTEGDKKPCEDHFYSQVLPSHTQIFLK